MVFFYLIFGAAILYLVYLVLRWFRQADPGQMARSIKFLMLGGLLFVLLATLLTGRLGFFLVMSLALIPFIPRLYRFLKGEKVNLRGLKEGELRGLTPEDARNILGVSERATEQEISTAHKKLIRKIHPDHGGSGYLAMQVNQAKEVLLQSARDQKHKNKKDD